MPQPVSLISHPKQDFSLYPLDAIHNCVSPEGQVRRESVKVIFRQRLSAVRTRSKDSFASLSGMPTAAASRSKSVSVGRSPSVANTLHDTRLIAQFSQGLGKPCQSQALLQECSEIFHLIKRKQDVEKRIRRGKSRPLQARNRTGRNPGFRRQLALRQLLALTAAPHQLADLLQQVIRRCQSQCLHTTSILPQPIAVINGKCT